MIDPLFLILRTLKTLIERMTRIFFLIFTNYFPVTPPEEDPDIGFVGW